MGSGACARGFRTPRSRESLEGSLPAHYEAQGQCPLPLPVTEGSGAPGIENAAVERRKASRLRKAGACFKRSRHPGCALRRSAPSLEGANNPLPFVGAKSKIESEARAVFRSEDDGACPGEVDTGSPSGHATNERRSLGERATCPHPHILNTPNFVSWIGAFSVAANAKASTRRVSDGKIIPSSHRRALP